jgi:hypothetical protein
MQFAIRPEKKNLAEKKRFFLKKEAKTSINKAIRRVQYRLVLHHSPNAT